MTNYRSWRLHRRTLLTSAAILGASVVTACNERYIASDQRTAAPVEQNTTKRRGVGLRALDRERASPGFTLFAPLIWGDGRVYLIDLDGNVVHTWNMPYPPGLSGYLTDRGTLFYNGRTSDESFLSRFPFKGGVVLEADWNGKILWEVRHPDHHHHGILLRNGNVLLNCMGRVPEDIARRVKGGVEEDTFPSGQYAARPKTEAGTMYSDYLAEVTPSGKTVWEWRTWEHLDPETDGITEIQAPRTLWAQGNSVFELPDGDLLTGYRPTSTVLRISRKTGEIVWKLGSPIVAGQHAPNLLANGNILIFDNGVHRLDDSMPFSRVIEVNPSTNKIEWKYQDRPTWNFFSPRMGNAQRLPNGNTLVCESSFGRFFEVTKDGEIVWEYVNPFFGKPFFAGAPGTEGNLVFRRSVTARRRSREPRPLKLEEVPLHHQILPIPRKPYALNWLPERLIVSHYEKDYGAAVRSLNALRDRLAAMDLSSIAPAEMRALKREELAAVGSVILHELYFLNLGGDGKVPATVATALERDFGSVRQWRQEFLADAQSLAGGPGWVVLTYSPYDGRLYNQVAIDHSHAMVGAVPILVLDMYEHAYHLEFGANAAAYVDVFMRIIDWTIVAERLMGATGGGQRHEAGAGKETLPSISVEELHTVMQSEQPFQVVDARPRNYVSKDPDTMPNAVWHDPERIDDWCAQLSSEAPVFVYCAYGFEVGRSVTTALRERGFDARYIRGGLAAWYGAGGARAVRNRQ